MLKRKNLSLIEVGFTVILVLILLVSGIIMLNNKIKTSEDTKYNAYTEKIANATNKYLSKNKSLTNSLKTDKGFILIKLSDLINSKYLNKDLVNPQTKKVIGGEELVQIYLNSDGNMTVNYPYKKSNGYLKVTNILIPISKKSQVNCYDNLNTLALGYINSNGNLVKDYLVKDNNIKCLTDMEAIDLNKIGEYEIKYSYQNEEKETKEATLKILVVDDITPTITGIKYNPTEWTKGPVIITASVNDIDSGIASYSVSSDCKKYHNTNNGEISAKVYTSNLYYICVKDLSGNMAKEELNITNIDSDYPVITLNDFDEEKSILSGTLADDESGVVGYALTNSMDKPTNWTVIDKTNSFTKFSFQITKNGTYYVWSKDAVGNIGHSLAIDLNNTKLKIDTTTK